MHDKMTDTTPVDAALTDEYLAQLEAYISDGGRLSHRNGLDLWHEVNRLRSSPPGGVDGELLAALKQARRQVIAFALDTMDAEMATRSVAYIDAAIAKAEASQECAVCDGRGHVDGNGERCASCNGTGEALVEVGRTGYCPDCNGTGKATPAAEGEREELAGKAETLAHWFDVKNPTDKMLGNDEVQQDLRRIATLLRSPALGVGEEELAKLIAEFRGSELGALKFDTELAQFILSRLTTEQRGNG